MANESSGSKLSSSKSIKKSNQRVRNLKLPRQSVQTSSSNSKITKFLFEDIMYCVGDFLLLRETNKTTAVAQLLKIEPKVT